MAMGLVDGFPSGLEFFRSHRIKLRKPEGGTGAERESKEDSYTDR